MSPIPIGPADSGSVVYSGDGPLAASNLGGIAFGCALVLGQMVAVALGRSLRTYSRSRLELVCVRRARPQLVRTIEFQSEITERAADTLAVVAEVFVACLLAVLLVQEISGYAIMVAGSVAIFTHFLASLIGRVWAETFLVHCWPLARPVRLLAWPLTTIAAGSEQLINALIGSEDAAPRPASVEVEIIANTDHPEKPESDVSVATRSLLEHVVGLTQLDASELMTPRSGVTLLPASVTARQAAQKFCETGLSRIPVFGENRDDILGILYAKDLFPAMVDLSSSATGVVPRKLVRPAYFVPETKNAHDLLTELRVRRSQIAIVLDEYGGLAGLITLEDLFEQLVGNIDDEHDLPTRDNRIKSMGGTKFEIDASMPVGQVNHRLQLQLPNDGRFQTLGGFAFNELGRLPNPGEMFVSNGVQITILEVVERSIRRVLMELRHE